MTIPRVEPLKSRWELAVDETVKMISARLDRPLNEYEQDVIRQEIALFSNREREALKARLYVIGSKIIQEM